MIILTLRVLEMNHLIAKVKTRKKQNIYKLISDVTVYNISPASFHLVNYSTDHNLDPDSWFKVENFSQKNYCMDFLKKTFVSTEYNNISGAYFNKIDYLCAIQNSNFCFQKINTSAFLKKKTLCFGESIKIEENSSRLFINSEPDALYLKGSDTLVFKNLATISSIFRGIDTLYKEATNDEVNTFLGQPFIMLSGDYDLEKVSKPNRSRIALAMDTLDSLKDNDTNEIIAYINEYCGNKLKYDVTKKVYSIANDEELKYLLYGIEQRYYTTPIGKEKRLANSIQLIN